MVKHIVQFRFRDDVPETTRREAREAFRAAIMALPPIIPTIRAIEVGFNINADEAWDICLVSVFDTLDDVRAYGIHPDHVAAAGIIKPLLAGRSCVDFETSEA